MPNLNGTGPHGQGVMTGGERGHCRDTEMEQNEKTEIQNDENNNIVYGLGRGGRPRGGGGFGKQIGRGFGKGCGTRRAFGNK